MWETPYEPNIFKMLYQSWSLFPPTLMPRAHFFQWFHGFSLFSMCLHFSYLKRSSVYSFSTLNNFFWTHYSFKTTKSLLFWLPNNSNLAHTYCFPFPSNRSLFLEPDSVRTMMVPGDYQWSFYQEKPFLHAHPLQTLQSIGHCTQCLAIY